MSMNYFGWAAGLSVLFFIIWIGALVGLAFIPASIAKRKGYSAGAFWCLGFFGAFIIPTIVACCIPDRNVPPPWYRGATSYPPPAPPMPPPAAQRACPQCGAACRNDAAFCLKCGAKL